jgi:hypothetical protein
VAVFIDPPQLKTHFTMAQDCEFFKILMVLIAAPSSGNFRSGIYSNRVLFSLGELAKELFSDTGCRA